MRGWVSEWVAACGQHISAADCQQLTSHPFTSSKPKVEQLNSNNCLMKGNSQHFALSPFQTHRISLELLCDHTCRLSEHMRWTRLYIHVFSQIKPLSKDLWDQNEENNTTNWNKLYWTFMLSLLIVLMHVNVGQSIWFLMSAVHYCKINLKVWCKMETYLILFHFLHRYLSNE